MAAWWRHKPGFAQSDSTEAISGFAENELTKPRCKADDWRALVIVKLNGGLGNQLFQYAAGYVLAKKHRVALKFDCSAIYSLGERRMLMDKYRLPFHALEPVQLRRVGLHQRLGLRDKIPGMLLDVIHGRLVTHSAGDDPFYDAGFHDLPKHIYLDGYWQDERYFKEYADEIKASLALKPSGQAAVDAAIKALNISMYDAWTCLHVRRGDLIKKPEVAAKHGNCPVSYYRNAMERLAQQSQSPVRCLLFSDDIGWAIENLDSSFEIVPVSQLNLEEYVEHALMQRCRHFIMSNSSYSWWAAWLAEQADSIVICPSQWFRFTDCHLAPERWQRLETTLEVAGQPPA